MSLIVSSSIPSPLPARIQILRGVPTSIDAVVPYDGELGQEQRSDAVGVPYEMLLEGLNGTWTSLGLTQYNGTSAIPPATIVRPFTGTYNDTQGSSTFVEGNTVGPGATDLQKLRRTATQVASGIGSFAAGGANTVTGVYGAAIGYLNTVTAPFGVALGEGNKVTGIAGFALGNAVAGGINAVAIGGNAIALGDYSVGLAGGITLGVNSYAVSNAVAVRSGSIAEGFGAITAVDGIGGFPQWIITGAAGLVFTVTGFFNETDATHLYKNGDILIIYDQATLSSVNVTVTGVTSTTITVTGITTGQATTLAAHNAYIFQSLIGPAWALVGNLSIVSSQTEGDDLQTTTTGSASAELTKNNNLDRSSYYYLNPGCTYAFDIIITGQAVDGPFSTARMHRSCMIKYISSTNTVSLVGSVDTIGGDKLDAALASITVSVIADNTNKKLAVIINPVGVSGGVLINWDAIVTAVNVYQGN